MGETDLLSCLSWFAVGVPAFSWCAWLRYSRILLVLAICQRRVLCAGGACRSISASRSCVLFCIVVLELDA